MNILVITTCYQIFHLTSNIMDKPDHLQDSHTHFSPPLFINHIFLVLLWANKCCIFSAHFNSAFFIACTYPYCIIIGWRICLLLCILGLHMNLTPCPIFCRVFLLCFIVFFERITLISCVLFLQVSADDMCSFNALVCCLISLLSAFLAWYIQ